MAAGSAGDGAGSKQKKHGAPLRVGDVFKISACQSEMELAFPKRCVRSQ